MTAEMNAVTVWWRLERYSARASNAFQLLCRSFHRKWSVVTDLIVFKLTFLNMSSRVEVSFAFYFIKIISPLN